MNIKGYISAYDGECLTIVAPFTDGYLLEKQEITECDIMLDDGRTISRAQKKKIHALFGDIANWTGYDRDDVKSLFKCMYIEKTGCDEFSFSNCSVTFAREFLPFVIDFCVYHGIACTDTLINRCEDISRYIYACLMNKRCACCGLKAEPHHIDAVGVGRNRKEIIHIGMRVIPLCRTHHSECHTIGKDTFCDKYHIFGIKADADICRVYKMKGE